MHYALFPYNSLPHIHSLSSTLFSLLIVNNFLSKLTARYRNSSSAYVDLSLRYRRKKEEETWPWQNATDRSFSFFSRR